MRIAGALTFCLGVLYALDSHSFRGSYFEALRAVLGQLRHHFVG